MQALNTPAAWLQSLVPLPLENAQSLLGHVKCSKRYHRCVSVGHHSASRGVSCPQPESVMVPSQYTEKYVLTRPSPHTAPPTVDPCCGKPPNGLG